MKLIYLIAGVYRSAGMERVLSLKASALRSAGHEVVIVTTEQRGQEPVFNLGEFRRIDLGINYELTSGAGFLRKAISHPFKQLRHFRRLSATLQQEKADIVVSMFDGDAPLTWKIKDGSRKVLEVHFSHFKKLQYGRKGIWALADKWRTMMDVLTASHYDKFVVLTKEDKKYWEEDYRRFGLKNNIVCIPNPRTFTPGDFPALAKKKMVLAAGRYTYQKGFDILVEAWAKIAGEFPDWELRIAGDGEDGDALRALAGKSGASGSIILGKDNDIKALYSQAALYAMTSRYEGLPMVLLEAQAAGLPIVSVKCKCGPLDVVRGGIDGLLVNEGDTDAFAAALKELINDEELRKNMGRAALENSERFSEPVIMQKWADLFSSL